EMRRVRTHPVWPVEARTRLQPSTRTAGLASAAGSACSAWSAARESSTQSNGGEGGFGIGGTGNLGAFLADFFGGALVFLGAGGMSGVRGASERGSSVD